MSKRGLAIKHGMTKTPEYVAWSRMKFRCYNETYEHRKYYITINVCDTWLNSFETFFKDMGERPSKEHSLDRLDGAKNYTKDNCRWATKKEQTSNRTNNIIYKGETAVDASLRLGGCKALVSNRISLQGWGLEKAFTTKLYKRA